MSPPQNMSGIQMRQPVDTPRVGQPQDMTGIQMMLPVDTPRVGQPQDMTGIQMMLPGGIDNGSGDITYPGQPQMTSGAMLDPGDPNNLDPQYQAYGQWITQNPTPLGTQQISFDDWKAQQGTALGSVPTTGPLSMSAKPGMMSLSMNNAGPMV